MKSDNYRYCDSWKSDNFKESIKEKMQRNYIKIKAKNINKESNNFTKSNIEHILEK